MLSLQESSFPPVVGGEATHNRRKENLWGRLRLLYALLSKPSYKNKKCCLNQGRIAMQTGSVLRPRIVLLLLMPLLLAACARATKAPAVLQGDFRVHDPSIMKQDGIKMRRIDPSTGKLAAADTKLYALARS